MGASMKFLTARWSNLFLATYAVPEELLTPRLPPGLELDRFQGHCFVSLVAFDFLETKVLHLPWPGFRDFPEINLRFYVRCGDQRGVVFIREFVPRTFIAFVARTFYNEPYSAATMSSQSHEDDQTITTVHRLDWGGRMNTISATGFKSIARPAPDSPEHFFKEHEWGFGKDGRGKTTYYRVEHPVWDTYPVQKCEVDLDWAAVYGPEWGFLQKADPNSTILALGSKIAVFTGKRLEK